MKILGGGVLGLLFLVFLPRASFALRIDLFDEIGINRTSVALSKLGDLHAEGGDPPLETLTSLSILDLPKKPTFLDAGALKRILRSRYGLNARVVGTGVRIYPLYTLILGPEIAEKLKRELQKMYPEFPMKFVDVILMKPLKLPKVPAEDLNYKMWIPGGRMDVTKYVRFQINEGQKEILNTSFPIRMVFHVPLWKSRRYLAKGTLLRRKDFSLRMKSQLEKPERFGQKFFSPFGKKLRKSLKSGEILYWKYIRK